MFKARFGSALQLDSYLQPLRLQIDQAVKQSQQARESTAKVLTSLSALYDREKMQRLNDNIIRLAIGMAGP